MRSVILIFFFLAGSLAAQGEGLKVAVIDMIKAFENHPKTKASEAKVTAAQNAARDQFIKESGKLKSVLDRYQKVVSSDKNQTEAEEIAEEAEELERKLAVLTTKQERDLEAMILKDRKEILSDVQSVVSAVNSERKFHLVIDISATSASGIPSIVDTRGLEDLTETVISRLKR